MCKGVIPLERCRVRKHQPVQRAVGSAELVRLRHQTWTCLLCSVWTSALSTLQLICKLTQAVHVQRFCLVLDLPGKDTEACKHQEYELSWDTVQEQVHCPLQRPCPPCHACWRPLPPQALSIPSGQGCDTYAEAVQAKWARAILLASIPRAVLLEQAVETSRCSCVL